MKEIIKLLIKVLFVSALIYLMAFSIYLRKEDEFLLLKDTNGKVISVFKGRINFIREGCLPWKYSVERRSLKSSFFSTIILPIPSVNLLGEDTYSIKIPVEVAYRIDIDKFNNFSAISTTDSLERLILSVAEDFLAVILHDMLFSYDQAKFLRNEGVFNASVAPEVKKRLSSIGIESDKFEFILPGYFPDNKLIAEAIQKTKEIRDINFNIKKQEILLKREALKERGDFDFYYEKLLKISSLIKDNPNILKYIYIDKLGGNIKVIISSDKTGLPSMFGDLSESNSSVKGDIDNLR